MRALLILATTFVSVTVARAETFVFRGAGMTTCANFAKQYAKSPDYSEVFFFSWAQGYISGLNMSTAADSKTYREMNGDTNAQMSKIRQYCNQYPLADYQDAVMDLYKSLAVKKF